MGNDFIGLKKLEDSKYFANDAISQSNLKNILKSNGHYTFGLDYSPTSTQMEFGSAFHRYIESEDLFTDDYAIAPECRKGSKGWKAFEEEVGDKKIIKRNDYNSIIDMASKIHEHPVGHDILEDQSRKEEAFFFRKNGHYCKGKFDVLTSSNYIVDWKTTTDASSHGFSKSIVNFKMHFQAAYYVMGLELAGQPVEGFIFAAIEKTAPYGVGFYQLSHESLAKGMELVEDAFNKLDHVAKSPNETYSNQIEFIDLPQWA